MSLASSLLASYALLSATPAPAPAGETISYQVRVVEVDGLGWRGRLAEQLHRVERPGPAMVWTAGRAILPGLVEGAKVVQAPKVSSGGTTPVAVTVDATMEVSTVCCASKGEACATRKAAGCASDPHARNGLHLELKGRKLDQGVLAHVVADDNSVTATHDVGADEPLPEVNRCKVDGEWLIPNDGLLLVSLGAHTVADKDGKAVARERLILVEAEAVNPPQDDPEAAATARAEQYALQLLGEAECEDEVSPAIVVDRETEPSPRKPRKYADIEVNVSAASADAVFQPLPHYPFPPATDAQIQANCPMTGVASNKPRLPMPALPGRSLPSPIAPDGSPATLPPLPDEELAEASADASAEPRPSPQAKVHGHSSPVDRETHMASAEGVSPFAPKADCGHPADGPGTISFRLPIGPATTMHVRVSTTRVRVAPEPAK